MIDDGRINENILCNLFKFWNYDFLNFMRNEVVDVSIETWEVETEKNVESKSKKCLWKLEKPTKARKDDTLDIHPRKNSTSFQSWRKCLFHWKMILFNSALATQWLKKAFFQLNMRILQNANCSATFWKLRYFNPT